METMQIIHVVVILRTGSEVWQGDGFWEVPDGRFDVKLLIRVMAKAILSAVQPLIDVNTPWKVKLEGEQYTLRGKLASEMAKRIKGLSIDAPERIRWTPVKENRYTLAEGANNG